MSTGKLTGIKLQGVLGGAALQRRDVGKPEGEGGPNQVQVEHRGLALRRAARRRAVQLAGAHGCQATLTHLLP